MSKRKPSVVIEDMIICIEHIQSYSINLSFEEFSFNFMVVEACLFNIQVIGEAVTHLPDNVKDDNPQIPWSLIKGMRNRLIHEYFGTDLQVVWQVIKNELPEFEKELRTIHALLTSQDS